MLAGLLLLGAALATADPGDGAVTFLSLDCSLPEGSVVLHPGLMALHCPGTRTVRLPFAGSRLSVQVLFDSRGSMLLEVPVAVSAKTRLELVPGPGAAPAATWGAPAPRSETALQPGEEDWEALVRAAAADAGKLTVDTAPTRRAPAGKGLTPTQVGTWVGLGLAVVGLSALAAGTTTIFAGASAAAPGPRIGVPGFSVGVLALTAPAMLVVGVVLIGVGGVVFLTTWLWERKGT